MTASLKASTAPTVMMLCSPLSAPDTANDSVRITPLLTFSDSAAILPLDAQAAKDAVPAPEVSGMLLSESLLSQTTRETSSILLCGSTESLSSAILNNSSFSNYQLMSNILQELGDAAPTISIPEAVHNMPRSHTFDPDRCTNYSQRLGCATRNP